MTRWLSIPAVILAGSISTGAQSPALSVPYSQFKLPNGLNVILHRDTSVPVVSVNVWYHVGSGNERPGRTGFAHLFEHVMFEGSMHVPEGSFDSWLEAAGGNNNGSTTTDRTNYYEDLPSNALELALFLESDRMGFLLDDKSPDKINGQRDVVKNEKRQSVDNQPYGQAFVELSSLLYPQGHPYSWSTIGSMEDLTCGQLRGRRSILPHLLRAVERQPRHCRRHRPRRDPQAGREVVRRRAGRQARAAADRTDGRARRRQEEDHYRSRAAAAPLPHVAHAGAPEARRRRRWTSSRTCCPAARTRVSIGGWCTSCRSRRTSTRSSSRRRSAAIS